jgi:hypothetical protein
MRHEGSNKGLLAAGFHRFMARRWEEIARRLWSPPMMSRRRAVAFDWVVAVGCWHRRSQHAHGDWKV